MKQRLILIGISIMVLAIATEVVWSRASKNPLDSFEFARAEIKDLTQTVNVTGIVKPVSEVDLAFESSGRIIFLSGKVGTHVQAGMLLASLASAELVSDLSKARASVASAEASLKQYEAALETQHVKLIELKKGTRPEEIAVKEAELASAQVDLEHTKSSNKQIVANALTQTSDVVNHLTDDFFDNDQTDNPRFRFQTTSLVTAEVVASQRVRARDTLMTFATVIDSLDAAEASLVKIKQFLSALSTAFNGAISYHDGSTLSQTTIDALKTSLATAQTKTNASFDDMVAQRNAIETKELVVVRVTQELALKKAPATTEQIAAQEAAIKQAEASVASAQANVEQAHAQVANVQAQLGKRAIRAPFSGVIAKQEYKIGEMANSGSTAISFLSDATYQIEAAIPEVDIGLVRLDQTANIELDAYPNERFSARVVQIDPAETKIEGVSTYRVFLELSEQDARLRSGMTADVEIVIEKRDHILVVPARAITEAGDKTFVRVLESNRVDEREVGTGLHAVGLIEIVSGLSEGEEIVAREKK